MIRLALLDDHPAVLAGLQRLLAPARDMEVLAAAADEVALARAAPRTPARRPDRRLRPRPRRRPRAVPPHQSPSRYATRAHLHRVRQPGAGGRGARRAGRRAARQERARAGADCRDPPDRGRRDRHADRQSRRIRGGRRASGGHRPADLRDAPRRRAASRRSPRACEPTNAKPLDERRGSSDASVHGSTNERHASR